MKRAVRAILSFIRKQESDMLVPMSSAMEELMAIAKMQSPTEEEKKRRKWKKKAQSRGVRR